MDELDRLPFWHRPLARHLSRIITQAKESIMALNDTQQTELLDAVSALGVDISDAADRVITAIGNANVDDPEVTQAVADLRSLGEKARSIASDAPPAGDGT